MKIIILPGYSLHNRDWADEIKDQVGLDYKILVHNWRHWKDKGLSLSIRKELDKILEEVGQENINIIAKSVGTLVTMKLLPNIIKSQVRKIILCGIPSTSDVRKKIFRQSLEGFPTQNIICFQNVSDPFATYQEVKEFMKEINPKIKIVKVPRSDHHYPYPTEFKNFLRS